MCFQVIRPVHSCKHKIPEMPGGNFFFTNNHLNPKNELITFWWSKVEVSSPKCFGPHLKNLFSNILSCSHSVVLHSSCEYTNCQQQLHWWPQLCKHQAVVWIFHCFVLSHRPECFHLSEEEGEGLNSSQVYTHGSGECIGEEACRMYWVHWKTRNAKLARKSLAESKPATGRNRKPVCSVCL